MKKQFLPYYLSRAILSSGFSILVVGLSWEALVLAVTFFGLFLIYLHSGWFSIDLDNPFMPLRRDSRGLEIQRKSLLAAVISGVLIYLLSSRLAGHMGLPLSCNIVFTIGIITYFVTQFVLFIRA